MMTILQPFNHRTVMLCRILLLLQDLYLDSRCRRGDVETIVDARTSAKSQTQNFGNSSIVKNCYKPPKKNTTAKSERCDIKMICVCRTELGASLSVRGSDIC